MRRSEYERSLLGNHSDSLLVRYQKETSRLDALLADLGIRVNLYEVQGRYRYRLLDRNDHTLVDGLDPAYANANDYRCMTLAVTERLKAAS